MKNILLLNASILLPDKAVTPALNAWTRLEPLPISTDLSVALSASIADPLWFLARQWQFLEFAGDDGGTPIDVRIEGESTPLTRFAPGAFNASSAARAIAYDINTIPLETLVEREPVRERHAGASAAAGLHLLRMLSAAKLDTLRALFLTAYPLATATPAADADSFQVEWAAITAGRSLDGVALAKALVPLRDSNGVPGALPPQPVIPAPSKAAALGVIQRWAAWFDASVHEGQETGTDGAWNASRQEYAFSASARTSSSELIVTAEQYADGSLDWHSVDCADTTGTSGTLGASASPVPTQLKMRPVLPSPVEFAGKPADRFWEFEDASVHFGGIEAGPTDLTRMLLTEFSLVYGNDWFIVPLRLPVGAFFRTTTFNVIDTFGVSTSILKSRNAAGTPWAVFELAGGTSAQDQFFLAPTLGTSLQGKSIEEVALIRDEMANVAWGVERRVQGPSGDAFDRDAENSKRPSQLQQLAELPSDISLMYRLATSVPENWIPLIPVPSTGSAGGATPVIQLQRGTVLRSDADGTQRSAQPLGMLLRRDPRQTAAQEKPVLRIEEEEVPREGAIVERAFQYARWFDGRSILWLGRRKRLGRGEGSSGLRYDTSDKV